MKPTRARTPYGPHYGDIFGGGCVEHAVTRSVRDSAALLDATAGPSPGDPYPAPPGRRPYAVEVTRPVERLRIAVTSVPADGRKADPECVSAVEDTAAVLSDLGHDVFERDLTELTPEVGAAIGTMYGAGTDWAIKYWIRELGREPTDEELDPFTRALWGHGQRVTGGDYLLAQTTLQAFTRKVAGAMTDFDLWLSPTLGTLPPTLGTMTSTQDEPWRGNEVAANLVAFPLVTANVTGNPADVRPAVLDRSRAAGGLALHGTVRSRRRAVPAGLTARAGPTVGRTEAHFVRMTRSRPVPMGEWTPGPGPRTKSPDRTRGRGSSW